MDPLITKLAEDIATAIGICFDDGDILKEVICYKAEGEKLVIITEGKPRRRFEFTAVEVTA